MNVGTTLADLGTNELNQAQITEVAKFFRQVRIFVDVQNAAQITKQRQQVIYAKTAGLRVIYGCSAPSVGADGFSTTFYNNTYKDAVLAEAAFAETNSVEEFCFANEEELRLHEASIIDPYALVDTYYKGLATEIKAVYTGIKSFCISNGVEPWIENILPGDIDRVGFNCYGDYDAGLGRCSHSTFISRVTAFKAYVNWGSRAYISEFNVDYNGTRFEAIAVNDEALAIEMANKYKVLNDLGYVDVYPFCWKYSASLDDFSMKKNNGDYRLFMQVMSTKNGRRFFYNT